MFCTGTANITWFMLSCDIYARRKLSVTAEELSLDFHPPLHWALYHRRDYLLEQFNKKKMFVYPKR